MADPYTIPELPAALEKRLYPSVTLWNRLEGRPRRRDFARAMQAQIPDALFLLARQWQMGEFQGEDAGSPATAKVQLDTTQLRTYQAAHGTVEPFDDGLPLEARVERRVIPLSMAGRGVSLDIRLLLGRQWLKMVAPIADYAAAFRQRYPIEMPHPSKKEDAHLCAHAEVWQTFAAVAGRRMDGGALYAYLAANASNHAWDGIPTILPVHRAAIDDAAKEFMRWYQLLFAQPDPDEDAWLAERLEYQFACAAPDGAGEIVLTAEEYSQGHLDWYNLDVSRSRKTLGAVNTVLPDPRKTVVQSLIPAPIVYDGMPNTRWWAFEDRRVNFGAVSPSTTDVGTLMFLEFGLVFANDWYLIPLVLPAGSLARVRGIAVTTVFGERFWIDAAGAGASNDWQRWGLFTLSPAATESAPVDTSLLLLPTTGKVQEGRPFDEVALVRDEVANMVWAVEKTVPLATGAGKSGSEAAAETLAYFRRLLAEWLETHPAPQAAEGFVAPIRYQVMNTVPEHWIPFVPVGVPDDPRAVQLQRGAMLRILEHDPVDPVRVRPRTFLMRDGLDTLVRQPYFIHEEEVPRAGITVRQAYQRTRWRNGKVVVWLGARKQTGRGEATSALAFDQVVPVPPPEGTGT
jgi:hypothetical protein